MVDYTPILRLVQPDFDQTPWDEDINNNFAVLDATYGKFIGVPGLTGAWKNSTAYVAGQVAVDAVDSTLWTCAVSHTSAASPVTFAQDRATHPGNWGSSGALLAYLPITGGTLEGNLNIQQPAGVARQVTGSSGTQLRWSIALGDGAVQSGGNNGANFAIYRFNDAGAYLDAPFYINRVDGSIGLNHQTIVSAPLTATQLVSTSSVSGTSFDLTTSGAYITADAAYTQFVQDSTLWRWQFSRANGLMQWVRGSDNVQLLAIDGVGGLTIAGGISVPGNVSTSSSITAAGNITAAGSVVAALILSYGQISFAYAQVTDFYMTRTAGYRVLSFANGYHFRFNDSSTEMEWVSNTALVMHLGTLGDLSVNASLNCNSTGVHYNNIGPNGFNFRWDSTNMYARIDNSIEFGIQPLSDERIKDNIAPSTFDCLAAVMATPLFQFQWKNLGQTPDLKTASVREGAPIVPIGFVAQRQHEVFPDSVIPGTEDGEGVEGATTLWQMNHNTLCAALFGAVQQLTARVEALEQQLAGRADS